MSKYGYLFIAYAIGFAAAYNAGHPWWHGLLLGPLGAAAFCFGWWFFSLLLDRLGWVEA